MGEMGDFWIDVVLLKLLVKKLLSIICIDLSVEFDLCDESGTLLFIHEKDPWTYGTEHFIPKATYFVVLFESKVLVSIIYIFCSIFH